MEKRAENFTFYLKQRITSMIEKIKVSNITLDSKQQKILKSAEYFSSEKNLSLLLDLYQQLIPVEEPKAPVDYPGNIAFNDFDPKMLKKVINTQGGAELHLYFNPEFIVDYSKLSDIEQQKFLQLTMQENIKISHAQNDQGIKILSPNKSSPKCQITIKDQRFVAEFSYELKIQGSPQRIGIITLSPLNDGPQILIATHFIKNGFHNKQHNKKTLIANQLQPVTNESEKVTIPAMGVADALTKVGLFSVGKSKCHDEIDASESVTCKAIKR